MPSYLRERHEWHHSPLSTVFARFGPCSGATSPHLSRLSSLMDVISVNLSPRLLDNSKNPCCSKCRSLVNRNCLSSNFSKAGSRTFNPEKPPPDNVSKSLAMPLQHGQTLKPGTAWCLRTHVRHCTIGLRVVALLLTMPRCIDRFSVMASIHTNFPDEALPPSLIYPELSWDYSSSSN